MPNQQSTIKFIFLIIFSVIALVLIYFSQPSPSINQMKREIVRLERAFNLIASCYSKLKYTEITDKYCPIQGDNRCTAQDINDPDGIKNLFEYLNQNLKSNHNQKISIALYGDSMIDTMGSAAKDLCLELRNRHPQIDFIIYNYGIGGQNVEAGFGRIGDYYNYRGRLLPPIDQISPDIIILGSFSYNPFSPPDKLKHADLLNQIIDRFQQITPHTCLLAEISPLRENFGVGPKGRFTNKDESIYRSQAILEQMDNVWKLKKDNICIIDAFHPSANHPEYTSPEDGIHPSPQGQRFTAKIISETIEAKIKYILQNQAHPENL